MASVRVIMSGGQQGAYCWIKNTFCRWGYISLRIKKTTTTFPLLNTDLVIQVHVANCPWSAEKGRVFPATQPHGRALAASAGLEGGV